MIRMATARFSRAEDLGPRFASRPRAWRKRRRRLPRTRLRAVAMEAVDAAAADLRCTPTTGTPSKSFLTPMFWRRESTKAAAPAGLPAIA